MVHNKNNIFSAMFENKTKTQKTNVEKQNSFSFDLRLLEGKWYVLIIDNKVIEYSNRNKYPD